MRTINLVVCASLFISSMLNAQPFIQWQNTIGGNANDALQFIQTTNDGGYIAGGYSYSSISGDKTEDTIGGFDYWIIRTDNVGNLLWQNTIGGNANDYFYSVQQTSDNGFIIGGYSESGISGDKTEIKSGESDYWVLKLDSNGIIKWQNTIGGDSIDQLFSVKQTADGGYILGGSSNSSSSVDKTENSLGSFDYWILKLDTGGAIQWQHTIGGSGNDQLQTIEQTADGGYIAGGYSDSDSSGDKTEDGLGLTDYWVVKLDSSGNIAWQNTIGGADYDFLYSIKQTNDFGYILGGNSSSSISGDKTEDVIGFEDYWIVKLDTSGVIQWQNTIGGDMTDRLRAIEQTPDSGYIMAGYSNSDITGDKTENSMGGYDYWVIKTDSLGTIQWQNTIGGNSWDQLQSMQITNDGGYILGGFSLSGISGDKTEGSQGIFDYWLVKLDTDSLTGVSHTIIPDTYHLIVYPNPAQNSITVNCGSLFENESHLFVFDVRSKIISEHKIRSEKTDLDITGLSNGIYFIHLVNKKGTFNTRFVKE